MEDEEDHDITMLILRVVFYNMKLSAAQLSQLQSQNLDILTIYWAKDDDL